MSSSVHFLFLSGFSPMLNEKEVFGRYLLKQKRKSSKVRGLFERERKKDFTLMSLLQPEYILTLGQDIGNTVERFFGVVHTLIATYR